MNQNVRRLQFYSETERIVEECDIVMGYEVFLGRTPESSSVIKTKVLLTPDVVVNDFVNCPEFYAVVLNPLLESQPLTGHYFNRPPKKYQLDWLKSFIKFELNEWHELQSCNSWEQFFRRFLALGAANRLKAISSALIQLMKNVESITCNIDAVLFSAYKLSNDSFNNVFLPILCLNADLEQIETISKDVVKRLY